MDFHYDIVIKAFLIGWFTISFEPLQSFFKWVLMGREVPELLTCMKCASFHAGWILSLFIYKELLVYEPIMAAVIAYTYTRIDNSIKTRF